MKCLAALLLAVSVHAADLLVAAASDLAPMAPAIEAQASRATQVRIRFSLGSSGSLTQQIENGAPFDVFLSAGENYVVGLSKKGFVDPATVSTYAYGRVALWSKSGTVRSLADLRNPGVLHIAIPNPEHAPYGVAARQAMERAGLWKDVQSRIVYGENVRQALEFAESGNADAVITSWTLLHGRGILLDPALHEPIRQTAAVTRVSVQPDAARRFLEFLKSAEGKKILEGGGLFPP